MNRIGVMAYHNLTKDGGDYALDIHADRFPVLVGCSVRSDAPPEPVRPASYYQSKVFPHTPGINWLTGMVYGKTYVVDMPALKVEKPGKIFFRVKASFLWDYQFDKSDAQIKFSLWEDNTFKKRLWDMDWIHTFAGLEKWQGGELPRL